VTFGSCNYCKKLFKCLYGSTSSLRNHLKTVHTVVYTKLAEKEKKRKAESESTEVIINMHLRNTEHLELSTKMDSKCTHKKDSLHVFWMLRVIYKKTEPNRRFFSKPNRNRTEPAVFIKTETEPNLKNPFRTSLLLIQLTANVFI